MEWDGSYDDDVKELRRQLKQDAKNLRRLKENKKYGPDIEEMLKRSQQPKKRNMDVDVFEAVGEALIGVFSFVIQPIIWVTVVVVLWNVIDIDVGTINGLVTGEEMSIEVITTAETATTTTESVSEIPVPIPMD